MALFSHKNVITSRREIPAVNEAQGLSLRFSAIVVTKIIFSVAIRIEDFYVLLIKTVWPNDEEHNYIWLFGDFHDSELPTRDMISTDDYSVVTERPLLAKCRLFIYYEWSFISVYCPLSLHLWQRRYKGCKYIWWNTICYVIFTHWYFLLLYI